MGILREYCFRKLRRVLMERNKIKHFHFLLRWISINGKHVSSHICLFHKIPAISLFADLAALHVLSTCAHLISLYTAYFSDKLSQVLWLHPEKASIRKSGKSYVLESLFVYRYQRLKNINVFLLLVCITI